MSTERETAGVVAPIDTLITVTLPLGAWHRIVAVLRKAPYETVGDILPTLIAQADPQISAAARAYAKTGKAAARIVCASSTRPS